MTKTFGYLPKSHKILWIALRVAILIWGIYGLFHGSVVEFLEAIFAIIFTHLWDFFQIFGKKSFIIEVDYLAQTMLNIFIFVAVVIGTTLNNRTTFEHFDLVTHFGSGFLSAWFGYDFANIVYRKKGNLGPAMSSLFSFIHSEVTKYPVCASWSSPTSHQPLRPSSHSVRPEPAAQKRFRRGHVAQGWHGARLLLSARVLRGWKRGSPGRRDRSQEELRKVGH